ncbi:hypothetical protein QBC34DRAFT_429150 [Podospora aff. communis PSN243]|uniref:Velvet domain-containing protein n=1 Tax=Podospora aff. communis PSN243 TaxID=3040156 RepID=A0AAV9GAD1_9PEZI|nr:hypothetical protein QBC34DRAFT_429150 [Podospora aff. communis PSN243]
MPIAHISFSQKLIPSGRVTVTVNRPLPEPFSIVINEKDLPHCYHWIQCRVKVDKFDIAREGCYDAYDRIPNGLLPDYLSGHQLRGPIFSGHMKDRKITFRFDDLRFKRPGIYILYAESLTGLRGSNARMSRNWPGGGSKVEFMVEAEEGLGDKKEEEGKEKFFDLDVVGVVGRGATVLWRWLGRGELPSLSCVVKSVRRFDTMGSNNWREKPEENPRELTSFPNLISLSPPGFTQLYTTSRDLVQHIQHVTISVTSVNSGDYYMRDDSDIDVWARNVKRGLESAECKIASFRVISNGLHACHLTFFSYLMSANSGGPVVLRQCKLCLKAHDAARDLVGGIRPLLKKKAIVEAEERLTAEIGRAGEVERGGA